MSSLVSANHVAAGKAKTDGKKDGPIIIICVKDKHLRRLGANYKSRLRPLDLIGRTRNQLAQVFGHKLNESIRTTLSQAATSNLCIISQSRKTHIITKKFTFFIWHSVFTFSPLLTQIKFLTTFIMSLHINSPSL